MKKYLMTIALAIIASASFAQRASSTSTSFFSTEKSDQPITIGVRAGINFASMTAKEGSISASSDSRVGFNAGISVDFPVLESFYVQSGLYLSQKGFKVEINDYEVSGGKYTAEANPMYLEIPVLASYRYNFSDAAQLQFNVGPYFAFGVGGKYKGKTTYGSYTSEYEIDYFGSEDDEKSWNAKTFDCGLQFGVGITFNKIYVGCAYQTGLTNVTKGDHDDESYKNNNFMINLGYNF